MAESLLPSCCLNDRQQLSYNATECDNADGNELDIDRVVGVVTDAHALSYDPPMTLPCTPETLLCVLSCDGFFPLFGHGESEPRHHGNHSTLRMLLCLLLLLPLQGY